MPRAQAALLALLLSACSTTDQQIEALIEDLAAHPLGSPGWQTAVDELVDIGRPAARELVGHLDPDHYKGYFYREYRPEQEQIRTGAARALGRIQPRGATAALLARIVVGYTDAERIACMWAMGEIGFDQAGLDALRVQLKDANPVIRLHAAIAVTKMDESDGAGQIEAALAGGDNALAAIALQGLRESSYSGVPLLTRLVQEPGPRQAELHNVLQAVREHLVVQLGAEDPLVRQRAARALGRIGDSQSCRPLLALLDDGNNLVRFNAAAALATMGAAGGIDFLFTALRDADAILRANAVRFLIQVQESSGAVSEQLVTALRDPNPLARAGAAQVLGEARVQDAVQALLEAAADADPAVRSTAAIALGQIRAPESRARLLEMLLDSSPTVSYYAQWALLQLGQG
ncbi:MAG: HEAT repeat domain-containing protein [Candidatus Latescibacterota bacterium]